MTSLPAFLQEHATGDLIPWSCQVDAARLFGLTLNETEEAILKQALLPSRYQRNRQTISTGGQLELFLSSVAVIGCGGLGGYIIEELSRLGVGRIVAIDPDVFEEHNLNRQLLSTLSTLGLPKVEAAAERVAQINPAVKLTPIQKAYAPDNGHELLGNVTVVVDALDSIPVRLELAETCNTLGIPLVHGAIGGWYGHVATQFPGEQSIQMITPPGPRERGLNSVSATRPSPRRWWQASRWRRSARSSSAKGYHSAVAKRQLIFWQWNSTTSLS